MKLLLILAVALTTPAFAKGSSHSAQASGAFGSGFVPIEVAQRVQHFPPSRNWQTADAQVLICPYTALTEYSYSRQVFDCYTNGKDAKGNDTRYDAWVPLSAYKVPGYEIAGFSHSFSGSTGDRQLLVYYRLPVATSPAPSSLSAEIVKGLKDSKVGTIQVDNLTIQANKIIVRRGKK